MGLGGITPFGEGEQHALSRHEAPEAGGINAGRRAWMTFISPRTNHFTSTDVRYLCSEIPVFFDQVLRRWRTMTTSTPALIDFSNHNLGFIYTPSKVYKTVDGGVSFTEVPWNLNVPASTVVTDILFKSESLGFVSDHQGSIYKTTDGGATWVKKITGLTTALRHISLFDSNFGFAVGDFGLIISTSDGGETWTSMTSNTSKLLNDVYMVSKEKGFAVGFSGTLLEYK
jgi:photosystem II stability/assembly factor-like uncharacterized protein